MGLSKFDERRPFVVQFNMDDSWSLTPSEFFAGSVDPLRWDGGLITTTDTVDVELQFWGTEASSTNALLGTVLIPALSGSSQALPAIDPVPILFPTASSFLMDSNTGIAIAPKAALTAGKLVFMTFLGGYV